MSEGSDRNHFRTVVIGGGQAGLAVGHYLREQGEDFVILDGSARVGDVWRRRWASLRLFTPARFDGLPGLPFPAAAGEFPTKDEMADYLEAYALHFELPVRSGVQVTGLERDASGGFRVTTSTGVLTSDQVVLATGTHPRPHTPPFSAELSPGVHQVHSLDYDLPDRIPAGDVLVVGAGTSGAQIALDLAPTHRTHIAGTPTPHIPDARLQYAGGLYWWLISHVLTTQTPIGRKARPQVRGSGGPLIHVSVGDLERAGVERLPRVAGVRDGMPVLEDGRRAEVRTVVWATGFRPDFSWISLPVADESGWPAGDRGVSSTVPGLYFVGVPFQFGLTSGLVGGVGRDAAFVAERIRPPSPRGRALAVSRPGAT